MPTTPRRTPDHRPLHRPLPRLAAPLLLALALLAAPPAAATERVSAEVAGAYSVRGLADAALRVAPGGWLLVNDVILEPGAPPESLELERFQVLTPDARLVVHGADGSEEEALPDRRFFRGRVAGAPGSVAVLAVGADGAMRGIVQRDGRAWVLGGGPGSRADGPQRLKARLAPAQAESESESPFSCSQPDLPPVPPPPDTLAALPGTEATTTPHTARLAIETDHEFFLKFNDTGAATTYITDVIAYASTIYDSEVNTDLQIVDITLWTTSADPWDQSNTACALYQMGKYWNDNRAGISRSLVHFFSGRGSRSGIAWRGVLCRTGFSTGIGTGCPGLASFSNYGGDYGYSGGLDADFDIDNPSIVWDIMVVSHEIGHNFSSPHTHCYNGLGGSSEPVDECYNGEAGDGCYAGTESLPCASPGAGCGTLMSYCHLLSPGLTNVALTLGTGHPHGVLPQRVPDRMRSHVEAVAAVSSCLDRVQQEPCYQLTRSHSGSGADPLASPARSDGCDPGFYLEGAAIALTADPADGWGVAGWSGTDDDASLSRFNGLTMPAADHAVSVTYQSGCDDLTLTSGSDSGVQTYDVCGTITAGGTYRVTGSGNVTMISRERVVFQDGFRVEAGGSLAVEVNP